MDGLTFTTGDGFEDGAITFTGTLDAINQALASLIYRSVAGFEGQDTISLVVNDQGNSGAGGELEGTGAIALDVTPAAGITLREESFFQAHWVTT